MKLYNKSKYPDSLIEPLLTEAGKAVKARTSNVVVVVRSCRKGYHSCRGTAHHTDSNFVSINHNLVKTDCGFFKIILPHPFIPEWVTPDIREAWLKSRQFDGLRFAEQIFKIASHEWQHIKQYQTRKYQYKFFDKTECAKNHDNRIWEKDAIKASNRAIGKPRNKAQDAILDLALWIDSNKREK